jgi:hypothetical protein
MILCESEIFARLIRQHETRAIVKHLSWQKDTNEIEGIEILKLKQLYLNALHQNPVI